MATNPGSNSFHRALIIGKPNAGKSLLFNRLTGLHQKVANFPGVTVEIKSGRNKDVEYVDYPGIYSFNALTKDEEVAIDRFKSMAEDSEVSVIICVLDATRLERSLSMGLQAQLEAQKIKKPFFYVLNMMDEIEKLDLSIDLAKLEERLGVKVVPASAKTASGIDSVKAMVQAANTKPEEFIPGPVEGLVNVTNATKVARSLRKEFGVDSSVFVEKQNRIDQIFLSSWLGGLLFIFIMSVIFQSIFTWSEPLMTLIEDLVTVVGTFVLSFIPEGMFADFVGDAIFGGFGAFLVFIPQIFVLTFIIGILEDTGYLARAAVICHRPLSFFGLSGKSFVPLLSGHACAIPAIFAARTIESPKKRFLTLLTIPLTSCSARLPVYALFITAFIPAKTYLGGLVGLRGLALFGLYLFGIASALIVSAIADRFTKKDLKDAPFVMELPPYRLPHWRPLVIKAFSSAKSFVTEAGGIIFTVTVVVWFLGYFPGGSGELNSSYLAQLGQWIEPIFSPLGIDWKVSVAILTSFLAREVFVGTLGTLLGIEGADENIAGLASSLSDSGVTLASGFALLIFYAIALQCVSTLAVLKSETGSYRTPVLALALYSALAYVLSLATFMVLS